MSGGVVRVEVSGRATICHPERSERSSPQDRISAASVGVREQDSSSLALLGMTAVAPLGLTAVAPLLGVTANTA
jgi:hypothetical protein